MIRCNFALILELTLLESKSMVSVFKEEFGLMVKNVKVAF